MRLFLYCMKNITIGINGFGRIGRSLTRVLKKYPEIEIKVVNDLAETDNLAHLLKYDSIHGRYEGTVESKGEKLIIDNKEITVFHEAEPGNIPWGDFGVDIVIEATGRFKTKAQALPHIDAGRAKKVILSAPPQDDTKTIVLGINDHLLDAGDDIVSNASCTTNSAAPLLKLVDDLCGIEHAYITTVHSYTTDQRLQDAPHKDFRRGRAAAESIVPTTTGAAKAITKVFPHLEGRIGGAGIRVPVPDGSLTDITFTVKKTFPVEVINQTFKQASEEDALKQYLGYTSDPIVSRDVIGSPYSCLFDEALTSVLGRMLKVVGWYDNEMGYSHRLADLILKLA